MLLFDDNKHARIASTLTTRAPTMVKGSGWGVLVALGDKSHEAKHLNRSTDKKADVTTAVLEAGDISLTLVKTTVGRMLMNAEGTARATNQVADILIDVPSGESERKRESGALSGEAPRRVLRSLTKPSQIPHPASFPVKKNEKTKKILHPSEEFIPRPNPSPVALPQQ